MKTLIRILLLLALTVMAYSQTAGSITPTDPTLTGWIGQGYSLTFGCSGCGTVTSWLAAGTLPPGLSFNTTTGTLSGVPTTAGAYSLIINAYYGNSQVRRSYTFYVDSKLDFITNANLGTVTAGTSVNRTIAVTTSGISEYSSLPANLRLTFKTGDTTAALTGSFAAVTSQTTQSFTVYAVHETQYSTQTASRTFTFLVNPFPSLILTLPSGTVGTSYQGSVRANGGTAPFTYAVSGTFPPGLQLDSGSGLIAGTPTAGGNFTFTLSGTDASNATASQTVTLIVNALTPTITTSALPNGSVGTVYTAPALAATGGTPPYTWTVSSGSLPAGLSLSADGVVSGTPTAAGTSNFTVQVKDSLSQTATKALSITVVAGLSISTASLPDGVVKVAYAAKVAATGGTPPYSFALSSGASLPPGLTLASTGDISGTPTTAGAYTFGINVFDATQKTASQTFKVTINPALAFTTTSLPAGTRGKSYSASIGATGGLPAYAFAVTVGSLPAGLSLAGGGAISGTPTASGTSTFTVRLSDQTGTAVTQSFSIAIAEPVAGPAITTSSLPDGTVGAAYNASLAATGTSPLAWSVTAGALPDGLSLASSGALSGTPTAAGTFSFTAQVSDGNTPALTASRDFSIRVVLPSLPSVSVTQVSDTTTPTSQPTFGISLAQSFPVDLTGTATISFQPDSGPGDPDVLFLNGKNRIDFTVPKGSSTATSADKLAFSAGTTSGTITITIALAANGQTLTPNPAATRIVKINKSAPVVTSVKVNRTSSGFEVAVIGYSNTREITGSTFHFSGSNLTSSDFTVAVAPVFTTWYGSTASAQFGTQFLLTVPFTLSQGAISSLTSVQVTLSNTVGSGSGTGSF